MRWKTCILVDLVDKTMNQEATTSAAAAAAGAAAAATTTTSQPATQLFHGKGRYSNFTICAEPMHPIRWGDFSPNMCMLNKTVVYCIVY